MKRSILAVATVLALGSVSAFAQTAGVRPSFNDAPDLAVIASSRDANASTGATRSDASKRDARPGKTLNSTFNYPAY
jgi:hypothetical protein